MKWSKSGMRMAWYFLLCLLAIFTYFYGLDSQHIPKNGDEYPYEHITRLTAASGRYLPLQSQLDKMRNTKPPLLFWQGIQSTEWGKQWTLWNLRYPSVIYTLMTAGLLLLLGRKLTGKLKIGVTAALAYLAFFSTYRFGRPFLTNPPEVFWIFLPFFVLLHWRESLASRWLVPSLIGISIGIGFLYKSFALGLPVALGLIFWYLHHRQYRIVPFLKQDAQKVAIALSVALALFAMWFVLDPDPHAIWMEFVLGENIGKFDPHGPGYIEKLFMGNSSIWSYTLAFLTNPGFLTLPVLALFFGSYQRRRMLTNDEKLLWIWVAVMFLSFALPSQRSGRYLLAVMPALAMLCALNWELINRKAFIGSILMAGVFVMVVAFLALRLEAGLPGMHLYTASFWLLITATGVLIILSILITDLTRPLVNVVILLTMLCFALFLHPFDGILGNYSDEARHYASGKDIGVPCNFRAMDEGYRFMLPGALIQGYNQDKHLTAADLAARYPLFAIQIALNDKVLNGSCTECKVIGQRLDIRGRQDSSEIKEMIFQGKVYEHLFVREVLLESPESIKVLPDQPPAEVCR